MEYLETFLNDIDSLNFDNSVMILIVFAISYFISKRFEKPIYRIIILLFSYYLITATSKTHILLNEDIVVSVGLIIPHVKFVFSFIADIFTSIKNMTSNTYFFFVSIFYKILRLFNWIKDILLVIKGFFFRTKKEENYSNSSHNEKQEYSYNESEDFSNRNKEQSNNDYSKKEDDYSSKNSYNGYRDNDSKKREQRYKEDFRGSYKETKEETIYEEYENLEHIADELKRFYSQSAYIILGVSENDDFSHIKKSYRALVSIYHPDKNLDEIELYTEITQNINSAYDKLKKIKGK
ncbi:hypothetical protein LPB137_10920 [Poseidonibacter parvus]|uniref:J domain-containing protein n=1 Tax=Poseidonibacter parvus TaxID=1850254 RepID=A0A1P8KNZ0_9BACT|nr:DnaJ domain-containing protein [Poseidonibacter parvus]APW66322.1 hypothetical protein LPB137_10920 [Poseidonibacter parvus]